MDHNHTRTQTLDRNVVSRKVVAAGIVDAVAVAVAAGLFFARGEAALWPAVALVVVASMITSWMVMAAILRLRCPHCSNTCSRQRDGSYLCRQCRIRWQLGRTTQ